MTLLGLQSSRSLTNQLFLIGLVAVINIRASDASYPTCNSYSWNTSGPSEHWRFTGHGCVSENVNPHHLASCLRGKTIVFIGDSVTRYQYLNMVYFLATGRWVSEDPYNENEHMWPSWPDFHMGTSLRLGCVEYCDCHRNKTDLGRENRFYSNCKLGINVGLITWLAGTNLEIGFDLSKGIFNQTCSWCRNPSLFLEKKQYERPVFKQFGTDIKVFISDQLSNMQADVIIINQGIWGREDYPLRKPAALNRLYEELRKSVRPGGKVVWKTTSPGLAQNASQIFDKEDFLLNVTKAGFEIFDMYRLTADLRTESNAYWDTWHFQPFVYKYVNIQLMQYLCGI